MSHISNMTRSKESTTLLIIALDNVDEDLNVKEIYACQDGSTLISVKLTNFHRAVQAGSLIFARGSIFTAMNRTKLTVDLDREDDRWVVMNPMQIESGTFIEGSISNLSDNKPNLTEDDFLGLNMIKFRKEARAYKIINYELTKEDKKLLCDETPNYIKGDGYNKMFEIFKVGFGRSRKNSEGRIKTRKTTIEP